MPQSIYEYMLGTVPMKRFGSLNDIVGAVVYLATDLGAYTTGSDILVDGGYSLW
jgi:NAD(P)-dependent dehydrogenase (short-subunit alcohol dehydrogenase family)